MQGGDDELVVTILFDNESTEDRLRSGWEFSALLEAGGTTVLFDTGADGGALLALGHRPRVHFLRAFPAELRETAGRWAPVEDREPGEEIVPGIRSTGTMGRSIPEQAVVLDTREGAVVLTGCAHPDVVRMAEKPRELLGCPLHAVLGGFHLKDSSREEIREVVEAFRRLGGNRAGPTHCSGHAATSAFRETFGKDFLCLGVGRVLPFPLAGG